MSLTNLSQIKGGNQLQQDVANLLASYDAAKVITSIAKATGAQGEDNGVYNADELFKELQAGIDKLSTDGSVLSDAINGLKAKSIKDIVKVAPTATYDADSASYTITFPDGFDTANIPKMDTTEKLPVYLEDNTAVFDENGKQLTFSFFDNAFSGTPSVLDVDSSKASKKDKELIYKAKNETFTFKVFPVGNFTLDTLPEDYLLDNEELKLAAYDTVINQIIVELAKDADLMELIQEAVSDEAIQNKITEITSKLEKRVQTLEEKALTKDNIATAVRDASEAEDTKVASEKAVADAIVNASNKQEVESKFTEISERLSGVEAAVVPVNEFFTVSGDSAITQFTLAQVPNTMLVEMLINGITYVETKDFTVDRATKIVTWTATAENEGFDITTDVTNEVELTYHVGELVDNTTTVTILHADSLPTTGTYKVGDMVYRVTPVANSNVGWVCSKAGVASEAEWTTFGVVDFEHTLYVETSANS